MTNSFFIRRFRLKLEKTRTLRYRREKKFDIVRQSCQIRRISERAGEHEGRRMFRRCATGNFHSFYSQSRCFFLGPIISSVVALQTDLARPWPAILCLAASSLSLIVCPAILSRCHSGCSSQQQLTFDAAKSRILPRQSSARRDRVFPPSRTDRTCERMGRATTTRTKTRTTDDDDGTRGTSTFA